jgi:ubiquinone/menaquinone biosynthesis C-methylase UbiE
VIGTIHGAAAAGFGAAAETYVTGRPDYPPTVRDWLRDVIGLGPGKTVADLGAGTGKFIPYLADSGARVIAVEPVDAMRAELSRRFAEIEALAGTAEAIPLPDASLDAVICAQAFHWFATATALAEIRRVLRPGGMLGLIWNVRDESVPWVAAVSALTNAHEGDTPRYKGGAWRGVFPAEGFTEAGERHARNAHIGSAQQVIIDRTLSTSFIAALPPEEQRAVERRLWTLIEATPELGGDQIAFPYDTAMYAYRKTH